MMARRGAPTRAADGGCGAACPLAASRALERRFPADLGLSQAARQTNRASSVTGSRGCFRTPTKQKDTRGLSGLLHRTLQKFEGPAKNGIIGRKGTRTDG